MTIVASTEAGVVGTRPERGGFTGLAVFSVVAGYWQFAPRVGVGVKGGSGAPVTGMPVVPGEPDREPFGSNSSAMRTRAAAKTNASTTATTVRTATT